MSPKAHTAGSLRPTDSCLQLFIFIIIISVKDAIKDTVYPLELQKQYVYIVYQKVFSQLHWFNE